MISSLSRKRGIAPQSNVGSYHRNMIIEIIADVCFGSMALLADGWDSAAFAITFVVYRYSRKHADYQRFTFGTDKAGNGQAYIA